MRSTSKAVDLCGAGSAALPAPRRQTLQFSLHAVCFLDNSAQLQKFMVGSSFDVSDNPERLKRATALVGTVRLSKRNAEKRLEELVNSQEAALVNTQAFLTCVEPMSEWSRGYARQLVDPPKAAFFQSVFTHKQFPDRRSCQSLLHVVVAMLNVLVVANHVERDSS